VRYPGDSSEDDDDESDDVLSSRMVHATRKQCTSIKPRSHTARCRAATRVAAASMTLKLNWFNFSVILTRVAARYRAATRVKMTC